MKTLFLTLLLITAGLTQEHTVNKDGFMIPVDKFEWTTSSKTLMYSYLTLSVVDLAQTINFLTNKTAVEANPLFGKHPETWKLITAKVAVSYGIYKAFDLIPDNTRAYFLVPMIVLQGYAVYHNSQYVTFKFSF